MFLKYNIFTLIWAFIIFLTCLFPGGEMPDLSYWDLLSVDKAAHAFIFCIFTILLITGFLKQYSFVYLRYNSIKSSLIIGIVYGGLIEILQSFAFIDRKASLLDFIANTIGCFVGIFAFHIIYKTKLI